MKTILTESQIQKYQNDGFIHIPGFLDAAEVVELRNAVVETVDLMGKKIAAFGAIQEAETEEDDSYYSKVFTQRVFPSKLSDTIKRYMLARDLGKMAAELEGVDGMRLWHDQALIKEPFGNPTGFHLDDPYWSFSSRHAISIWIALEDATPYNGCMCFVPGSQKLATFENVDIGPALGGLFKVYPEMGKINPTPVPMKAGDCSFHNGLTAHGAGANMTRQRRIAMTAGYMPVGSTFNGKQNVLPKSYFESLHEGDVLEDDRYVPLLYKK